MANFSRHYFGYFNLSVFGYFCLTLTPPCGVKGQRPLVRPGWQPWPNKVLDATLNIGLLSVTLRAELAASPGNAS